MRASGIVRLRADTLLAMHPTGETTSPRSKSPDQVCVHHAVSSLTVSKLQRVLLWAAREVQVDRQAEIKTCHYAYTTADSRRTRAKARKAPRRIKTARVSSAHFYPHPGDATKQ